MLRQSLYAALVLLTWAPRSVADPPIGGGCDTDLDCEDSGLTCMTADSQILGGYGPPGGLCTTPCLEDADCHPWDSEAACWNGYCFCTYCPFRMYEICPIELEFCVPLCIGDSDCGEGLTCDPWAGLCVSEDVPRLVGGKCQSDADCGDAPYFCLNKNDGSLGAAGLASGTCTAPCSSGEDCTVRDWTSVCDAESGSCAETCTANDSFEPGPNQNKCHGRDDLACENFRCVPQCADDHQCDPGLHCNPGTGLCQSERTGDARVGAKCDPQAEPDTCRGTCQPGAASGGNCVEHCILGYPDQCPSPAGARPMACVGIPGGEIGTGDLGECRVLCACTDDCSESDGFVCTPSDFYGPQGALAICVAATGPLAERDDCSPGEAPNDCPNGSTRACRCEDGRLGVAECSTDQSGYGACMCPDEAAGEGGGDAQENAAGAAGDAPEAARARERSTGCQMPRGSVARWPMLVLLSLPILQLARYRRRTRQAST